MNFERADAELNAIYKQIMLVLKQQQNQQHQQTLINAQRAWIKYKDSNCDAQFDFYADGTMRTAIYFGCKTELTIIRRNELKEFYAELLE